MEKQTEFEFTLPHGYTDDEGKLHKTGAMRLGTALDELMSMKDARVQGNPGFLSIILFSRVVTRLGTLPLVDTEIIERLPSEDLAFLEKTYERINGVEDDDSDHSHCCSQCGCGHQH